MRNLRSATDDRTDQQRGLVKERMRHERQNSGRHGLKDSDWETFFTYKTTSDTSDTLCAVIDSGACASILGKVVFDKALESLNIEKMPDMSPNRSFHKFGNSPDQHKTLLLSVFLFLTSQDRNRTDRSLI